ncbi:hypothetical protein EUBIFOR_00207 [Holdemanella biformis DSM 3989]|uniref:Uncharacterized protein n=1 Tax=Holdemanella biformis DSM 3989 TaxID=518637 RepID=B7C7Q9_9FIRM|nr:hypothetical protein EUBIFOR_00207 [Holdemanella biformis DSM 3989]
MVIYKDSNLVNNEFAQINKAICTNQSTLYKGEISVYNQKCKNM